jgi:MSHA biogenesis protein MshG
MPIFHYQGRDQTGKLLSGKRIAQSSDTLSILLMKEGVLPITIKSSDDSRNFWQKLNDKFEQPVTRDDLGVFARQMYSLCKTGVPLATALKNLAASIHNRTMRNGLFGLVEYLESGQDLASAMQNYPAIFTPIMVSMVRVGQSSGHLAESFLRINQYVELEGSAIKNIKSAMRYPVFVLVAMISAMILINMFVIPAFSHVFAQAKVELPGITLFFMATSGFIRAYWVWILIFMSGCTGGFYYYINTLEGRYHWDKFMLHIPYLGTILKRIVLLRFSQSFSITINSGIPLIEGIDLIAQSVNNEYAKRRILSMREAIEHGNNLAQAAAITHLFTPLELQILGVSEETGEMGVMFEQIASFYRREVDYDLKRLGDVIEPLLIVVLSGMILMLAFAVYLPIWNMAKLTKMG